MRGYIPLFLHIFTAWRFMTHRDSYLIFLATAFGEGIVLRQM